MNRPAHSTGDGPDDPRSDAGKSGDARQSANGTLLAGALLVIVLTLLYRGNLHGPFLFDDIPGILENPNIESLTPLGRALDAPEGNGADRRPLVALSLAVNYAIGEREAFGYHVYNLLVHVLATLALFGLVRQSVILLGARGPGVAHATSVAFAGALVWSVHPLHTSTLHMVINRNELMVGLFAFLTLYAAARSFRAQRPGGWIGASVLACLLGAASKEVIAAIPLVVLLYDRTFHSASFRSALARGRSLYAGLALSWLLLAFLATTGSRGESAGFDLPGFGPLDYLWTQTGALLHYLRLVFWPRTLAFDYHGWPVPAGLAECWREGLVVLSLFALSLFGFSRGKVAGFLGLACFLILAPSSSFIPLAGALVAEHRMYIPSAALLGVAACLAGAALRHLGPGPARGSLLGFALLGAGLLGARTVSRNLDFRSRRELWGATVDVRPDNARAWNSYGMALAAEELTDAARRAYERTLSLEPRHYRALVNLGNLDLNAGDWEAARRLYERALEREPREADPHYYLGLIAVSQGRSRDAARHLRQAAAGALSGPLANPARQSLAWVLATASDDQVRDGVEALRIASELATRTGGRNPRVLDALAAALAETGSFERAVEVADRAAQLALSRGQEQLAAQLEQRRKTYVRRAPWREGR